MKLMGTILIIAVVFAACKSTKQTTLGVKNNGNLSDEKRIETPVSDTTDYVKDLYLDKNKYIGKPASELFNDLQIKIKSYSPEHDRSNIYGISTEFLSWDESNIRHGNGTSLPYLTIRFETPILKDDVTKALDGRAAGVWGKAEQDYYGKQIVKDLE